MYFIIKLFQLRLIHKCIPIAFVVVKAGGKATNGKIPILDVKPEKLHQRSPFFVGSAEEIDKFLTIMNPSIGKKIEEFQSRVATSFQMSNDSTMIFY